MVVVHDLGDLRADPVEGVAFGPDLAVEAGATFVLGQGV